jgi:hypothetical protein
MRTPTREGRGQGLVAADGWLVGGEAEEDSWGSEGEGWGGDHSQFAHKVFIPLQKHSPLLSQDMSYCPKRMKRPLRWTSRVMRRVSMSMVSSLVVEAGRNPTC